MSSTKRPAVPQPASKPKPTTYRPWLPAEYTLAEVMSVKALVAGTASEDQQKMALDWIIRKASRAEDLTFFPGGEEGRRDSDFAAGRSFVGKQIVKLIKMDTSNLE